MIEKLPRAAVTDYVARYYHAGNMVIVACGKVDHAAFVALAKKRFGRLPKGRSPKAVAAKISSGAKLQTKDIEQLHLILGFAGPGQHSRDIYATQVLAVILGGSSSSRLFQKVREKRGLVYTVSAGHSAYNDTGLFQIYAGTDPERAGRAGTRDLPRDDRRHPEYLAERTGQGQGATACRYADGE